MAIPKIEKHIAFCAQQTEEKEIILVSDMNPSARITAEDLEDGLMLEAAIHGAVV